MMNLHEIRTMGLPVQFPDANDEAFRRAQEFRRLPPEGRWREIAAMMELGFAMVRSSPRRAEIERRWADQEAEWRRIQQKLFAQHGK